MLLLGEMHWGKDAGFLLNYSRAEVGWRRIERGHGVADVIEEVPRSTSWKYLVGSCVPDCM